MRITDSNSVSIKYMFDLPSGGSRWSGENEEDRSILDVRSELDSDVRPRPFECALLSDGMSEATFTKFWNYVNLSENGVRSLDQQSIRQKWLDWFGYFASNAPEPNKFNIVAWRR